MLTAVLALALKICTGKQNWTEILHPTNANLRHHLNTAPYQESLAVFDYVGSHIMQNVALPAHQQRNSACEQLSLSLASPYAVPDSWLLLSPCPGRLVHLRLWP